MWQLTKRIAAVSALFTIVNKSIIYVIGIAEGHEFDRNHGRQTFGPVSEWSTVKKEQVNLY